MFINFGKQTRQGRAGLLVGLGKDRRDGKSMGDELKQTLTAKTLLYSTLLYL